ncbi:hypothetical protein [Streptacidiphilus sp. P02-A3a]|uniref:hypothetical protein n=1 Tax=Streptacidiphilus sp. P02-A3a TaxID=2704468 RepID=UPI0015FCD9B2|nr:hypothetical protein [Streptacidiphilus sp. P02-A3a]QMU67397.1 hypothetical protein GXP74_03365 [Streptacidiphilus sp. P02-A3a]
MEIQDYLDTPALGDGALQIYLHALDRSAPLPCAQVGDVIGLGADELELAIRQLGALRLVSAQLLSEGLIAPVAPDSARLQLLSPLIRELEQKQRAVDAARAIYAQLSDAYQRSATRSVRDEAVTVVRELSDVRRVITELSATCTNEVITAQPGGGRTEEVLRESLQRTQDLLGRGVRMRTLYQHTARYSPPTTAYVALVTEHGAEVRTLGDGFMRMLLFDQEVALIELRETAAGAVLVREPSIVHFMYESFERAWSQASDFDADYHPESVRQTTDDTKATIIKLLIDGVEDKVVARRLGMSLRTCQRHVSEILRDIGARNRLQAGYLIHRYGLDRVAAGPEGTEGAVEGGQPGI